jgi:hypothetical protein
LNILHVIAISGLETERIAESLGRILISIIILCALISWVYWFFYTRRLAKMERVEKGVRITPDGIVIPLRFGRLKVIPREDVLSIRSKEETNLTWLEMRTRLGTFDLPWTVAVELVTDGYKIDDPGGLLGELEPLESDPDVFSPAEID